MSATAELEAPQTAPAKEPKVIQPHPWAGMRVFYWQKNAMGELSASPAMLIAPHRTSGGWVLNCWRFNVMQGRPDVKFSDKPKDCCWTWPPAPPKTAKA